MMGLMLMTSEILNLLKYLMMGLTVMRARTKISVLRLFGATLERTVCGSRHRFPMMIITGKTMKIPRRTIIDYDPKTKGDNSDDLDGDRDYNNTNLAGR